MAEEAGTRIAMDARPWNYRNEGRDDRKTRERRRSEQEIGRFRARFRSYEVQGVFRFQRVVIA